SEDLPGLMETWRELLVSGEAGEIEARLRRHDGIFRWFLIRVEPLLDETGKIVRWYGTSSDIDVLSIRKRSCGKMNGNFAGLPTRSRIQLSSRTPVAFRSTQIKQRCNIPASPLK